VLSAGTLGESVCTVKLEQAQVRIVEQHTPARMVWRITSVERREHSGGGGGAASGEE
jgi:hypothetical protein